MAKKLTAHQKGQCTRRRNARRRAANRAKTADGRLFLEGACEPAQIRKRLLWFAREFKIPVAMLPPVGTTMSAAIVNFADRHDLSLNWLISGSLVDLRVMLRTRRVSQFQRRLDSFALMAAVDERLRSRPVS